MNLPTYNHVPSGIIDSHAHVFKEYFGNDPSQIIKRALSCGVKQIVNPSVSANSVDELLELANLHDNVYVAAGVHPHEAKHFTHQDEIKIKEALIHPKVVAVGECGLDYYYNLSEKQIQITVFKKQIDLAYEFNKPLIIHCREAWDDLRSILSECKSSKSSKPLRGVFHCFTGDIAILNLLLEFDFYVSFSGIVTFPKTKEIQAAAKKVSIDRIMVETDCPYLAPQQVRGKTNEPAYVWYVAEKLAELREVSLAEIASACSDNARRLFNLPTLKSPT